MPRLFSHLKKTQALTLTLYTLTGQLSLQADWQCPFSLHPTDSFPSSKTQALALTLYNLFLSWLSTGCGILLRRQIPSI
jgi:hypothetical protein